ncbi:hypothetical protein BC938DRAFT_483694 [Jimgerdemannia flammicorona]|uniref:Uncharacterized protein n=1 Tax=Jimgerdemannia flammicorona TaxID=994334 RepID=A0A433QBG5_9FUNG|nr:hypothetical protein BC938DRAFT_483694 [Jimgerdemannia flammicorona]
MFTLDTNLIILALYRVPLLGRLEICARWFEVSFWKRRTLSSSPMLDMFLTTPHVFDNLERNISEMDFAVDIIGPIMRHVFSDVPNLVRCGDNVELSHSECARLATPAKLIRDRSKCLRTNKCILDANLRHEISDKAPTEVNPFKRIFHNENDHDISRQG